MSARGALVSSPDKDSQMISESKRYIPLLWLGFLTENECGEESQGRFELNREEAIARARKNLPFLSELFADMSVFRDASNEFLERLGGLTCESIGIEITELVSWKPPYPNLQTAVASIEAEDKSYTLSLPPRTAVNPATGDEVEIPGSDIASTKEMVLGVCLLSARHLERADDQELAEFITGYIWK
jgi:hypothetical protein